VSDSDVEGLTQLYLGSCISHNWNDLEQILVNHHGDALVVASQEDRVRWVQIQAVAVAKVSLAYQLRLVFVLVEPNQQAVQVLGQHKDEIGLQVGWVRHTVWVCS
jgi:hypothetical protein